MTDMLTEKIARALADHRRAGFDAWKCYCKARIEGTSPQAERNHQAEAIIATIRELLASPDGPQVAEALGLEEVGWRLVGTVNTAFYLATEPLRLFRLPSAEPQEEQ